MSESKWVEFRECFSGRVGKAKRKTKVWEVISRAAGFDVGTVEWYPHWRQYVFAVRLRKEDEGGPFDCDVYNPECLRDIADFAEARTKEHHRATWHC
jgi:hypothetical protein